jgi:hypothetical protein
MPMPQLKNLAPRNPLSIIALSISLIYGISAILLGASVKDLQPHNQDRLVWFIILFPVAILAGFLWLVIGHHRKLYDRKGRSALFAGGPCVSGDSELHRPADLA